MVAAQFESDPVIDWNEGIQDDYDPMLKTHRGFTLNEFQIPEHNQTGFGKNLNPMFVDSIDFKYTAGDIIPTPVNGKKGKYFVYRLKNNFWKENSPDGHPGVQSGGEQDNTLSLEKDDGNVSFTWAFSPLHKSYYKRGYAINGEDLQDKDDSCDAWTV